MFEWVWRLIFESENDRKRRAFNHFLNVMNVALAAQGQKVGEKYVRIVGLKDDAVLCELTRERQMGSFDKLDGTPSGVLFYGVDFDLSVKESVEELKQCALDLDKTWAAWR